MKIFYVNGNDMVGFISKFNIMEIDYDKFSPGIFKGFEGFSPIDIEENQCNFIVSINEANDIIGVIKFKRYKMSNHAYLSEEDFNAYENGIKNYKGIMFVDVREDFRQKGVARNMIKHLADITNEETSKTAIRLGKLTYMGKQAKLLKIFKEYLPNRDVKL